jgi:autotransporter-associated beta strand protein
MNSRVSPNGKCRMASTALPMALAADARDVRSPRVTPIFWLALFGALFGSTPPLARALSFKLTYDNSATSAPAGFFTALNSAIQFYETTFTDPITINLQAGWGTVNNQNMIPGVLGESSSFGPPFFTFSQVKTALANDAKSASDQTAVGNVPTTDPTGGANFSLSNALAKALGLKAANALGLDGFVGFSTTASFTFDPNNRAVANKFDFIGVAEHEISEVMGRFGLGQNGASSGRYSPIDLFRYSSPGVLDLVPENGAYFSINGGTTVINTFNGTGGGDLSDWAGATIDSYNASGTVSAQMAVSAGDVTEMDTIGYDVAVIWNGAGGNGNWSTTSNWFLAPSNGSNLIFAGTTQTSTTNNSLSSVGSVTFDNTAGSFTLSGNAVTISGGITNNSSHAQTINLNLTLSAAQQFNAATGNLVLNGTIANGGNALTVVGSSNTTLSASVSGAGGIAKEGSGMLTLSGDNSYAGGTTVNAGTLIVAHANALGAGSLAINNTAIAKLQAGLTAPVQLPSLTIAGGTTPTATLDVTDNNMVIHNGSISTTIAQLKSGLNSSGTLWTGAGIQSSPAAADAAAHGNAAVFAVGAIRNIDKNSNLIYSTWPASPSPDGGAAGLATTDVLVKYTYFGDADLNGVVDNTTDYDLWSNGFTNPGLAATNGWLYGDFDFSGVVDNTTDYDLWSTGFAHQGGPLRGNSRSATPVANVQPVPEPSGLVLAALGMAGAVAFARRCRLAPGMSRSMRRISAAAVIRLSGLTHDRISRRAL